MSTKCSQMASFSKMRSTLTSASSFHSAAITTSANRHLMMPSTTAASQGKCSSQKKMLKTFNIAWKQVIHLLIPIQATAILLKSKTSHTPKLFRTSYAMQTTIRSALGRSFDRARTVVSGALNTTCAPMCIYLFNGSHSQGCNTLLSGKTATIFNSQQ